MNPIQAEGDPPLESSHSEKQPNSSKYPYTINTFFRIGGLRWTCSCCFDEETWEELKEFPRWHEEEYRKKKNSKEKEGKGEPTGDGGI